MAQTYYSAHLATTTGQSVEVLLEPTQGGYFINLNPAPDLSDEYIPEELIFRSKVACDRYVRTKLELHRRYLMIQLDRVNFFLNEGL